MKYRQPGYRDDDFKGKRDQERGGDREARQEARQEARKVRHAMERTSSVVLRCADCGHQAAGEIEVAFDTCCEKCGAALHNCRNCRYLDPQARFECRQPVPKRLTSKTAANRCEHYEAKAILDATGKRAKGPANDPRSAFDALFKK